MDSNVVSIVALGISMCSFLVALSALIWNVMSFRRSGPRTELRVNASVRRRTRFDDRSYLSNNGGIVEYEITVRNLGRLPIDVSEMSVNRTEPEEGPAMSSGVVLTDLSPCLPYRLESASSETWSINFGYLRTNLPLKDPGNPYKITVKFGNGVSSVIKDEIAHDICNQLFERSG